MNVTYSTNFTQAVTQAAAQGKYVLALFCRPGCTECAQTLVMWNTPVVAPTIMAKTVPFRCDDIMADPLWKKYGQGLAGASLPLIALIDPKTPDNYVFRTNGLISGRIFGMMLQNQFKLHPLS